MIFDAMEKKFGVWKTFLTFEWKGESPWRKRTEAETSEPKTNSVEMNEDETGLGGQVHKKRLSRKPRPVSCQG
jgi:hypothetical protein